jgi:hypothetical protein
MVLLQSLPSTRSQGTSARAASFAMVCPPTKRSREAQTYPDQRCQTDAGVAPAHELSQARLAVVREHQGRALEAWPMEAIRGRIAELACIARGRQDDLGISAASF